MNGSCGNCSTSGPQPLNCNPTASQVPWDGGSLCTGFSGEGSVVDAVQDVANAVCALSLSLTPGVIPVNTDGVTLINVTSACFAATNGDLLTEWMNEAQGYICGLLTTVADFDFTQPITFNTTGGSVTSNGTFTQVFSKAIVANTLNQNEEYLMIETWVTQDTALSTNSGYRILWGGTPLVTWDMSLAAANGWPIIHRKDITILTRKGLNILSTDWHGFYKSDHNVPRVAQAEYDIESDLGGVDFTVSNVLEVEARKTVGTISLDRIRITKVVIPY
jgi:hypothetical protein